VEGPRGRAAPGQFVGGHPQDRPRRERGVDGVDQDDAFLPLDQMEEGGAGDPAVQELHARELSPPGELPHDVNPDPLVAKKDVPDAEDPHITPC
jgi:hypothetical protein